MIPSKTRRRFESRVRGALKRRVWPVAKRMTARGRTPFWNTMERRTIEEVGPLLLDVQRRSAVNFLTEHTKIEHLAGVGMQPAQIRALRRQMARIRGQWRRGEWEGEPDSILWVAEQTTATAADKTLLSKNRNGGKLVPPERIRLLDVLYGNKRADLIASTEVTRANTIGEDIARAILEDLGFVFDSIWYTQEDERVCEICAPLHGAPSDLWRQVAPDGTPAHQRCRCEILYVLVAMENAIAA